VERNIKPKSGYEINGGKKMSEESTVVNRHVGYSFSLSVEQETRVETGAKYPDKRGVSARLSGNSDTFEKAVEELGKLKRKSTSCYRRLRSE